jgi:hypothetical protein
VGPRAKNGRCGKRRLPQSRHSTQRTVVEIVAVKALGNHSEPQLSIAWPQRIQSKTAIFTRFQQTSISHRIWFGTRFSTQNSSLRINQLQGSIIGIWGSLRLLEVQFRLHSARFAKETVWKFFHMRQLVRLLRGRRLGFAPGALDTDRRLIRLSCTRSIWHLGI